jgi:hypothetical protein
MFNSPQANLGAAMTCLQQANPTPRAEAAMVYLRVATALVEEKSATAKFAVSTSSHQSHSRSNQPAHSNLPPIQEEVDQNNPDLGRMTRGTVTSGPTSTRTGETTTPAVKSTNTIVSV